MLINQLFLRTVDDLDAKSQSRDPYELLRSSQLIRQLVLDANPLCHQVNKEFCLKISFRVLHGGPPPLKPHIYWTAIDPDFAPTSPAIRDVKRDEFLALEMGQVGESTFTLKDIVSHAAHVLGGVHAGEVEEKSGAQAIASLGKVLKIGNADPAIVALHSIGRVVVTAMQPLKAAILNAPRP